VWWISAIGGVVIVIVGFCGVWWDVWVGLFGIFLGYGVLLIVMDDDLVG